MDEIISDGQDTITHVDQSKDNLGFSTGDTVRYEWFQNSLYPIPEPDIEDNLTSMDRLFLELEESRL